MEKRSEIEKRLRYRILGLLHAGRLQPGERLPSIRALAREEGIDHRVVAEAYRKLQEEDIVEIRLGSGVYVAGGQKPVDGVLVETAGWLADLFVEGWHRGLGRGQLGELAERCASARLRCACIESNRDHMTALAGELEEDFSLEVAPLLVEDDPAASAPLEVRGADLVVATVFHADRARAAAAQAGVPFVLVTYGSDLTSEIDRRLREGPVTAVVVDPKFAARGSAYFSVTRHKERIRYVLVDRVEEEGIDPSAPEVLVTRAARRVLGMEDYHLLPPPLRVISPSSARSLYETIVRTALHRTAPTAAPPPTGVDGGGSLPL